MFIYAKLVIIFYIYRMKITALIENTSTCGLPAEHGLSLHIRLADGRCILFDMGQGSLFASNAASLDIDLKDVYMGILSHGHYDHGGGLATFLEINDFAKVYVQRKAFEPHFSLRPAGLEYIGLDKSLEKSDRLVFCDGAVTISDSITVFGNVCGDAFLPHGNRLLFGPSSEEPDTFGHEQNLLINENGISVLIAGCAHSGIVNIINTASELLGHTPDVVVGGMHLVKSGLSAEEETCFISDLAHKLLDFEGTRYVTMHCTGEEQYLKLKGIMEDRIEYLRCGESIEL